MDCSSAASQIMIPKMKTVAGQQSISHQMLGGVFMPPMYTVDEYLGFARRSLPAIAPMRRKRIGPSYRERQRRARGEHARPTSSPEDPQKQKRPLAADIDRIIMSDLLAAQAREMDHAISFGFKPPPPAAPRAHAPRKRAPSYRQRQRRAHR